MQPFQQKSKSQLMNKLSTRLTHIVAHWQGTQSQRTEPNLVKEPQFLPTHDWSSTNEIFVFQKITVASTRIKTNNIHKQYFLKK